jgi:hypothetical protein
MHFLRIVLALMLLGAAGAKLYDLPGFVLVLRSYGVFPVKLLWPVAIGVTGVELLVGGWLASGRKLLLAAESALVLHSAYTCWAVYMLLRDKPILNCGCFGSSLVRPLSWHTVAENMVLVGVCAALILLCRRNGRKGVM